MTTCLIKANVEGKALTRTEHGAVKLAFEEDGGSADRDDDQLDEDDDHGSVRPVDRTHSWRRPRLGRP